MRYIKIREKTYNAAMMKLKMDYGDEAIPISHKYVKEGGLFNSLLFAKEVVELTAAVQDKKITSKLMADKKKIDLTVGDKSPDINKNSVNENLSSKVSPGSNFSNKKSEASYTLNPKKNFYQDDQFKKKTAKINDIDDKSTKENAAVETKSEAEGTVSSFNKFEKEFDDIKRTLSRLVEEKNVEISKNVHNNEKNNLIINNYINILKHNDFDAEECNDIITEVTNSVSKDDLKDKYKIEKNLKDLLKNKIVTTGPIKSNNRKKIIMFIGPTGVGKTTTMAKLGAICSLREGKKVSFVTIDNYRIAATEQLKKYAEIMRIPVNAVNNQKEFKEIIAKEKADIIMVDTSGRSHRNELKISEIKSFADQIDYDVEKFLCVSANTKKHDLNEVFKAFETIQFNSIVITKVDETSFVGNVVNVADKYNKPIAYFTNGQEVPNDIVVADPDKIVDMMMGNLNN